MPPWQVLVNNALIHGFGFSLGVAAIMAISIALAPDMWVGDGKKSSRAANPPFGLPGSTPMGPFHETRGHLAATLAEITDA